MNTIDRILGCLYGGAIGDALGAPYEGYMPHQLPAHIAEFGEYDGSPLGQYTDDTQMTLATLESIVECEGIDLADIGDRLSRFWADRSIIAPGGACTHAALALLDGTSVFESGADIGSAGNGAAMRIGFLGFYPWETAADRFQGLKNIAAITHKDPTAIGGAIVVAEAIRNPTSTGAELASVIEQLSPDLAQLVRSTKTMDRNAIAETSGLSFDQGISPYVVPTVLGALHANYENPDSWLKTVQSAIGFGGDVDTVACIAGAIAGARLGWKAIPEQLISEVVDSARIRSLAVRYYGLIKS